MVAVHSRIRVILLGLGLAALASCGGSEPGGTGAARASSEPYVIKFPHVVAPATPKGQMAQRFKELAEQRFPGRVRVEVYPSAQLMEDTESIEALAFGEVQMIATSVSLYDRLIAISPTPVVALSRALAIAERDGPGAGLDAIAAIDAPDHFRSYPFYPAALGEIPSERMRLFEQLERLREVDDVDPAPLAEDEAAHLRVPAARLVAEVHAGLQQLSHGDD